MRSVGPKHLPTSCTSPEAPRLRPHRRRQHCWRADSSCRWRRKGGDGACRPSAGGTLLLLLIFYTKFRLCDENEYRDGVLTVFVSLVSSETIPYSVRVVRMFLYLASLAMTAQVLTSTSLFVDVSKFSIRPNPWKDNTVVMASYKQRVSR